MNYAELIAEVAGRSGEPGFALRAAQYVTQAEAELAQEFLPMEYPYLDGIAASGTNWLLASNQEIYVAAVLKQFYLSKLDTEKASIANQYLRGLIDNKKASDRVIRYSGEKPAVPGAHP